MTTPRPAGWKGGSEDFGFLRTFDGHIANDRVGSASADDDEARFGGANVRWGFDRADLSGDYGTCVDTHDDD
jgi:hypothetical protein